MFLINGLLLLFQSLMTYIINHIFTFFIIFTQYSSFRLIVTPVNRDNRLSETIRQLPK